MSYRELWDSVLINTDGMVVIVIYAGWLMYGSDRYTYRLADRSLPVCC